MTPKPGDAITIRLGDKSALSFYRTHCVKTSWTGAAETWCGLRLSTLAIGKAKGEQPCADCMAAVLAVDE